MGARVLTSKFSHVVVSVFRRAPGAMGVGIVFRTRQGTNLRKMGYATAAPSAEHATYEAIVVALREALRCQVHGLTIFVDNPRTADQLNRRVQVPDSLMPLFVQVRCQANMVRRVRFEIGNVAQVFAARRLARAALASRQPVNIEYDTPLLPLSFSEDAQLRPAA